MTIAQMYAYKSEMRRCMVFFKSRDNELYGIFKDESKRVSNILSEWLADEIKQSVKGVIRDKCK